MAKNIILYHNHCTDGFGAAWAAYKKFGLKAEYIGVAYGKEFPLKLEGKNVYILDFCYSKEAIKNLLKITKSLVVIDHHITNKEAVEIVPKHIFDATKHSGAYLTWKYFHPGKKVPKLLEYVEGVDLWKWNLPHAPELYIYLRHCEKNFKIWNKLAKDWENSRERKKYVKEGAAMLKIQNQIIKDSVHHAQTAIFNGYKTLVSNSQAFIDDIADALIKKVPPIAIVWSQKRSKIKVRLNSNGKVDVAKLAEKFGGGGHKASAAFVLKPSQKLPWKVISDKIA